MRPPRVRVTVRQLLIAVAILAALLAAGRAYRRREHLRARAAWYAEYEEDWRETSKVLRRTADELAAGAPPSIPFWGKWDKWRGLNGEPNADRARLERFFREETALYEGWAGHCARMRRKWEDAAGRPWVAAQADPVLPWYANDLHVRRYEDSGGSWPPTPDWKPSLPP